MLDIIIYYLIFVRTTVPYKYLTNRIPFYYGVKTHLYFIFVPLKVSLDTRKKYLESRFTTMLRGLLPYSIRLIILQKLLQNIKFLPAITNNRKVVKMVETTTRTTITKPSNQRQVDRLVESESYVKVQLNKIKYGGSAEDLFAKVGSSTI